MSFEELKALLGVDPKLITGVLVALGAKELLAKFVERYWAKKDEADTDHKKLENIEGKIDCVINRLDLMEQADKESLDNDILILEHNILFLQRKAIKYGKVSKGCMPRYRMLYKRYKSLLEKSNIDVNGEAETNHEIVERMFRDGEVVDSFWEMYK